MKRHIAAAVLLLLASGGSQKIVRAEDSEQQRLNAAQNLLLADDGWRERAAAATVKREAEAKRREAERKAATEDRLREEAAAKATEQILEAIARAWAKNAAEKLCGRAAIPDTQSTLKHYGWLLDSCRDAVEAGEMEAVVEAFLPGMRACLLGWHGHVVRNKRPTNRNLDCLRNKMNEGL